MNIDKYFNRIYNKDTYNCAHFVCDVWEDLTGECIRDKLTPLLLTVEQRTGNGVNKERHFTRIRTPVEPSIVLARRRGIGPHVGIYISGMVLHITDIRVELVSKKVFGLVFDKLSYYK